MKASKETPIARVLLRLPAELHRTLTRAAASAGLSFNEFCVRRLRAPAQAEETSELRSLVIDRGRTALGDRLRGVVVMGSWARGDAAAHSDIDVLLVIDAGTPLTRDLYRAWDQASLMFEGRIIDAHFVHAPAPDAPVTGVWCEAAVDGLVWFDADGRLGKRLAQVRRAIATGRVVRGTSHGQPYWKGAA
jgi:predicted nucleotidyltransferase